MRKRLRNGEIDNIKYQRSLILLRRESKELKRKVPQLTDDFFEENFPMIIPMGTQKDVMNIIRGKKKLESENRSASRDP